MTIGGRRLDNRDPGHNGVNGYIAAAHQDWLINIDPALGQELMQTILQMQQQQPAAAAGGGAAAGMRIHLSCSFSRISDTCAAAGGAVETIAVNVRALLPNGWRALSVSEVHSFLDANAGATVQWMILRHHANITLQGLQDFLRDPQHSMTQDALVDHGLIDEPRHDEYNPASNLFFVQLPDEPGGGQEPAEP